MDSELFGGSGSDGGSSSAGGAGGVDVYCWIMPVWGHHFNLGHQKYIM